MTEIWFLLHNLLNGAINRNKITVEASVQCTYLNVSKVIQAKKKYQIYSDEYKSFHYSINQFISKYIQIKTFVRVPNQTSTYFINCTKNLSSDQDQIWAHEHGI